MFAPVASTIAPISPWRMIEPEYAASPGFRAAGSDSPVSAH
jgi:hypothetical protein